MRDDHEARHPVRNLSLPDVRVSQSTDIRGPGRSYPAAACEMRSGDTPVIPVDARAE